MLKTIINRFFPHKKNYLNMTSSSTDTSSSSSIVSDNSSISNMSINTNNSIKNETHIEELVNKQDNSSLGEHIQGVFRENIFSLLSLGKHIELSSLELARMSNTFLKYMLYDDITSMHTYCLRKDMIKSFLRQSNTGLFPNMEVEVCVREGARTLHDYTEPGNKVERSMSLSACLFWDQDLSSEEAQTSKHFENLINTLNIYFFDYSLECQLIKEGVKQIWKVIKYYRANEKLGGLGINCDSLNTPVLDIDPQELPEELSDSIRPYWTDRQEGSSDATISILQEIGGIEDNDMGPMISNFEQVTRLDLIKSKFNRFRHNY